MKEMRHEQVHKYTFIIPDDLYNHLEQANSKLW